jgi:uncharacterized protein (TIRG00374 family)
MPGWVKKAINPKVLLPAVVIIGAIALLFSFGNPAKIIGDMAAFNRTYLIWIFLLSVLYELVRFLQWLFLLREQRVQAPLKAQIYSFAGGEATRFIPVGNYFQNYLLSSAEGTDFAYTSAATTLIIVYEVIISLTGLVILGLGGMSWLTPTIVIGAFLVGFGGWYLYEHHGNGSPPAWIQRHQRARKFWEGTTEQLHAFGNGAKNIIHAESVGISLGLATIYLIAAGGILYLSLEGIGWTRTPFLPVLAVYFFSLAFGLIFPLPVDIGVTELSGVGAFLAIGVDRNAAIGAMLINRVLTLGFSLIIFLIVAVVMWDETKRAWTARGMKSGKRRAQDRASGAKNTSAQSENASRDDSHADETDEARDGGLTYTAGSMRGSHDGVDSGSSSSDEAEDTPRGAATA